MNTRTKILVIPKSVAIAACLAVLALFILLVAFIFRANSSAPANLPSSSGSVISDGSHSSQAAYESSGGSSENLYTPGVYTSSIMLDNSPVSVKVTVDADNINAIDLIYTDEAITTMYPMLGSCFNELASEVCAKNSTKNITYSADNRYTAAVILNGIENALQKAGQLK